MSLKKIFFITGICLYAFAACKKDSSNKDVPVNNNYDSLGYFTLENLMNKKLNVDIYDSAQMAVNSGPVLKIEVQPNEKYQLSLGKLQKDKKYWIDWYDDDFTTANWPYGSNGNVSSGYIFWIYKGGMAYLEHVVSGSCRLVYIKGNQLQTEWYATDAYSDTLSYSSVWNTLPANERDKKITFRHNMLTSYLSKRANGTIDSAACLYGFQNIGASVVLHIEVMGGQGTIPADLGWMRSHFSPTAKKYSGSSDTALFATGNKYWVMVRR